MPVLLQINDLNKAHGVTTILEGASASFASDQKIGVIGRNGAGKSTLCRIITGHETADSGTIVRNSALRLSYLEQHDTFLPGETVVDYLMRYTDREHWECGEMAARFQIDNDMLYEQAAKLPGGFQTRVKLTAMLLRNPNFLILDEPSNYLDLSTLILLENFLQDFNGGYLVVSHDREFLKKTCDHTLEVENGRLALYPGNIEEYFEFKEEQLQQKQAYNRGVEKKRDQLQAFVDRFRAKASTAARAQSKMKQLSKLKTIEIAHELATVKIHIPPVEPKGGTALLCSDLAVGYPEKDVASGINFEIERGQRVAILGNNGEGKSTFLKTVSGRLEPKEGSYRWGTGLKVAYYAQHVFSSLNDDDDIIAHLTRESAEGISQQDVLNMAGCFLFKGDDTKKKVKVLSGGERARLILAGILLSRSHVLLLDEPTNHLDFETVEALAHALQKFAGTVFFISNDRTFVNLIATNILEVKSGRIVRYPGSYEDYVYHLEAAARGEETGGSGQASAQEDAAESGADSRAEAAAKKDAGQAKKIKVDIAKLQKKMDQTEERLQNLSKERDRVLADMRDNPFHFSKDRNEKLKLLQSRIEETETEWYGQQAELDKLKKSLPFEFEKN